MTKTISFRAGTALIVAAYVAMVGVLVVFVGKGLGDPVAHYVPQVSWLTPDTTAVRIAALKAAGLAGAAGLYALVVALSFGLIASLAAGGFAWGVLGKGKTVLGVDKAVSYLTVIAALYALATVTESLLHGLGDLAVQGGLSATPAMWFATMIPSAAILARVAALMAHDAGSLLAITLEGEPGRLAKAVETAEAEHGASSLEARLVRMLAARAMAGAENEPR